MEFLQGNWIWLLLGLGAVWFLLRRGRMGCGMGGHGSHDAHAPKSADHSHNGHGSGRPEDRDRETAAPRRRRGC